MLICRRQAIHVPRSLILSGAILLAAPAFAQAGPSDTVEMHGTEIVVTASRLDLLGRTTTASQGTVTQNEAALRPVFRPGELFESIPGLIVTVHSGEGKANQYLIRGYNLDHGTDFANFVDDMPVNRPTNTHGQGYSDIGFLLPQIVSGIDYTKGPFFAAIGDFGAVASAHTRLANDIPTHLAATVGTDDYQEIAGGGTVHFAGGRRLLGAVDLTRYNGPWRPGLDFGKVSAALRYSQGDARDGFSLTGLFYASAGGLTTDQPIRAVQVGLIGRFGTVNPTDHSKSLRFSLSAHVDKPVGPGQLAVSLYGVHSTMELVNDFTHYLYDPVSGDQEAQDEGRTTLGGAASYTVRNSFGAVRGETMVGLQARYDDTFVSRRHTLNRTTILPYCTLAQSDGAIASYPAVNSYCNADRVHLLDLGPYIQNTLRWTPWLRTVVGVREEYYHAADQSGVTGTGGRGHQMMFQPKGSMILGPWAKTEFYFSAGRGLHSNDVRGVFGTVPQQGIPLAGGPTPLLAATTGYEMGVRSDIVSRLLLQLALFQQDFSSELRYNADTGQDEAGAPSRRQGIEVSGQYHPLHWLELNANLAFAKPRYRSSALAAFGLAGPYIADAPDFIYSAGVLVVGLGGWSGSLVWRRLGTHHLADGEAYPTDQGFSEWNLNAGYTLSRHLQLGVGVFNLFNSRDAAADYYYTSRLPGERPEGVTGFQIHPLEPRSARFTLKATL